MPAGAWKKTMVCSKKNRPSKPPRPARRGFPRRVRLSRESDFHRVFADGRSAADAALVVYAAPNAAGFSRVGVVAPRRIGGAVERNRAKRRIREAYRSALSYGILPQGYDFIAIAKKSACNVAFDSLKCSLAKLATEAAAQCEKP